MVDYVALWGFLGGFFSLCSLLMSIKYSFGFMAKFRIKSLAADLGRAFEREDRDEIRRLELQLQFRKLNSPDHKDQATALSKLYRITVDECEKDILERDQIIINTVFNKLIMRPFKRPHVCEEIREDYRSTVTEICQIIHTTEA